MAEPLGYDDRTTWSGPMYVQADKAVYYVYLTRVQGDRDKVFRFPKAEHDKLMLQIATDISGEGLDRSWVTNSCEPYICTERVY